MAQGAPPARKPAETPKAPLTRPIPSSGEQIPLVGLGSWITFNVGNDRTARAQCTDVMREFFGAGGRLIAGTFVFLGHIYPLYFRFRGDKAYGLGISDDKQGLALILHTVAMLKAMSFSQYGTLTVLFNGDEEISSPGSRALITKLGAEFRWQLARVTITLHEHVRSTRERTRSSSSHPSVTDRSVFRSLL